MLRIRVFWNAMPCTWVNAFWQFNGLCCLHLEAYLRVISSWTDYPWRWWQCDPSECLNHVPSDTVSYPRQLKSSPPLLWELKILHIVKQVGKKLSNLINHRMQTYGRVNSALAWNQNLGQPVHSPITKLQELAMLIRLILIAHIGCSRSLYASLSSGHGTFLPAVGQKSIS